MSTAPLFHPRVVARELGIARFPDNLAELHARLDPLLEQLRSGELHRTQEVQLQGDFVRTVFGDILGYRTRLTHSGAEWDIEREENVARSGRLSADGAIGWFKAATVPTIHAVIELKGAKQNLDRAAGRDRTPVAQAFDYALETRSCRWIIVSNYRETRLYHRNRSRQDVEVFKLEDLADFASFQRFWLLMSRAQLLPDKPHEEADVDRLLARSDAAQRDITDQLYKEYASVRNKLFEDLCKAHSNLPPLDVLRHTQKLLDRVLFIAFAEDRGLLPSDTIRQAITPDYWDRPFWENLKQVFCWVDTGKPERGFPAYNGGLFAPDPELDALEPSNAILAGLERIARYDFGEDVSVDVLGHIFEQSITDLEDIRSAVDGTKKDTTSKRKKHGVFYTPGYVTRYLVEQTLGRALEERFVALKAQHQPDSVRGIHKKRAARLAMWTEFRNAVRATQVLDPACGSGAFLIAAFDFLLAAYDTIDGTLADLREGQRELWDLNRAILNGNLFGVDLNPESIEITKLSLWLKTASKGNALTWLDGNIRCGNSVVSDATVAPRAFDWQRGAQAGDWTEHEEADKAAVAAAWCRGFDVVIGNPPYVRQEWLGEIKPHLQAEYRAWHGMADLFVYFFELGLRVLKPGGRLGFIVANKWLKGGYAAPLRGILADETVVEQLIDFGHAPIFPDADAFPSILTVRKLALDETVAPDHAVQATVFPREELGNFTIADFVQDRRVAVPQSTLGTAPWSMEPPAVRALMARMREVGTRLEDVAGSSPYRGVMTGYNPAYLLDDVDCEALLGAGCPPELLRPYLRGSSVERWHPGSSGEHLLLMKSSGDHDWPWRGQDEAQAEATFAAFLPAVYAHMKGHEQRLRKRTDQGKYWWELRSCAYYELFDAPKIVYQVIQFHPSYAIDESGSLGNDKVYFVPTSDMWLLSVLNSPLMWWHNWRHLVHMKDEALNPSCAKIVGLPIPPAPAGTEAPDLSSQAVALSRTDQQQTADLVRWLASEFGVTKPGRALSAPGALSTEDFLDQVKKRRPRGSARLKPAALRELKDAHRDLRTPMLSRAATLRRIELRLSELVNSAYGLSPEDVDLVRRTAPVRMPPGLPSAH